MKRHLLTNWLENTLSRIDEAGKENNLPSDIMRALRELQLLVSPLVFSRIDPKIKFIAFFLNLYINTIFMDLLGDIPDDRDEILQTVRKDFFEKIYEGLKDLLENMRNEDNPLPALQNLVGSYSEAVNKINYKDIQLGGVK